MRNLTKPSLSSVKVYKDCLSVIRSTELSARLNACTTLIQQAEQEFENKITKGLIHTIRRETLVNGDVSVSELKNVYTGQMVGNAVGRVHYDKLILSAPQGLCPLCAHRDATTLDHYLPKAKYPRLSIVPVNLIPACKDCNTGKTSSYPTTPETETLHPYYDNIENVQCLKININKTNPVSVFFYVEMHPTWTNLLFERVKYHFESYNLNYLYSVQSGRELCGIKNMLIKNYDSGAGVAGVKKILSDNANSRFENNKNSWQTALYLGLSNDDWFCDEGFRQI